ncbi:MAG: hypothetical protein AAF655_14525 [Bacteroidota bacterium]
MKVKRVHLEESAGPHDLVLGIVSDIPVWKLCWDLNQRLGLSLKKVEGDTSSPPKEEVPSTLLSLFASEELSLRNTALSSYEDRLTHPSQTFLFLENDPRISPKKIRAFRYFFVIRTQTITEKEAIDWMQLIKGSDFVRAVADLSDLENLNNIQY